MFWMIGPETVCAIPQYHLMVDVVNSTKELSGSMKGLGFYPTCDCCLLSLL